MRLRCGKAVPAVAVLLGYYPRAMTYTHTMQELTPPPRPVRWLTDVIPCPDRRYV